MKFKLNEEEYNQLSLKEKIEYHERRMDRFRLLLIISLVIAISSLAVLIIGELLNL